MYSFNIDYIFNRVYDVLLWCKYTWLFVILKKSPEDYIAANSTRTWDGLRDRGWFNDYFAAKTDPIPTAVHESVWQKMLHTFGIGNKDTDGDGIPNLTDTKPNDPENLTTPEMKERFEPDYTFGDRVRELLGLPPKDSDGDGVPDSYEVAHGLNKDNPDTDRDGSSDGHELLVGTDPKNNDTDGDLVLDGRDEMPLDRTVSSVGVDTDGDGVSDRIETLLHTDGNNKDSDGDGIPDGMDTYPMDPLNQDTYNLPGLADAGIHLSIQNPVLGFFADFFSLLALFGIAILVVVSMKWLLSFWRAIDHYEHHFHHDDHDDNHAHGTHGASHTTHTPVHAGVPGLPIMEEEKVVTPATPPSHEEFESHPRWAIVEGYMSSPVEALWRIGIIEADNMLREVLQEKGYEGIDVGEMLKGANFKTVQLAWDAHTVRNKIAHEGSKFTLTAREAKRVFVLYESVFLELQAIH